MFIFPVPRCPRAGDRPLLLLGLQGVEGGWVAGTQERMAADLGRGQVSLGNGLAGDSLPVWDSHLPKPERAPCGLTVSISLERDPASGAVPEGEFYHLPSPGA